MTTVNVMMTVNIIVNAIIIADVGVTNDSCA